MSCKESYNESEDYYKILECDRTATFEEIKRNYQRLALLLHPDKMTQRPGGNFQRLQQAWSTLRDPESRKQYDAELSCREHSECLLYDTISLSDMEFTDNVYLYPCRCGGQYVLEICDYEPKDIVIPCDECSFSIQIRLVKDKL